MKSLEELREFFAGDKVAMGLGMTIESAENGGAVCTIAITDDCLNAIGTVQGGLIYTLADFAFAVSANSEDIETATLTSTINYMRPAFGKKLTAHSIPIQRSKTICLYQVTVTDEEEREIAYMTALGYRKVSREKN